MPRLWTYHLHYMEDLVRGDAADWRDRHGRLIDRWIEGNPPFGGDGWDPYPISLRVVFWIKWALAGGSLTAVMRDSLATQVIHLEATLEHHLAGNHLWANAKALALAGLFFEGAEPDRWYRHGRELLERERPEQILADGGHFERSTSYHALITEDVLDLINIHRCFGRPLDRTWEQTAHSMSRWLSVMTRTDGLLVAWNDGAASSLPTATQIHDYSLRLGLDAPVHSGDAWLSDTGYARLARAETTVWFDMAPIGPDYLPGHAHADTLNVEIEVKGQAFIVDTGASTYEVSRRREIERGTESHNCVMIDDLDSSEMWASFRVGRRARPVGVEVRQGHLAAGHTGYRHKGVALNRTLDMSGDAPLVICDSVRRRTDSGPAAARFHFAPGLTPSVEGDRISTSLASLAFHGHNSVRIEPCEIAMGFNKLVPSFKAVVEFDSLLETTLIL